MINILLFQTFGGAKDKPFNDPSLAVAFTCTEERHVRGEPGWSYYQYSDAVDCTWCNSDQSHTVSSMFLSTVHHSLDWSNPAHNYSLYITILYCGCLYSTWVEGEQQLNSTSPILVIVVLVVSGVRQNGQRTALTQLVGSVEYPRVRFSGSCRGSTLLVDCSIDLLHWC